MNTSEKFKIAAASAFAGIIGLLPTSAFGNPEEQAEAQQSVNPAPQHYPVPVKDARRANRNIGILGASHLSRDNNILVVVEGDNEELFREAIAATSELLARNETLPEEERLPIAGILRIRGDHDIVKTYGDGYHIWTPVGAEYTEEENDWLFDHNDPNEWQPMRDLTHQQRIRGAIFETQEILEAKAAREQAQQNKPENPPQNEPE